MTIRVLICDDHEIVREGLATILNNEDDVYVELTTNSVAATIAALKTTPDAVDVQYWM